MYRVSVHMLIPPPVLQSSADEDGDALLLVIHNLKGWTLDFF